MQLNCAMLKCAVRIFSLDGSTDLPIINGTYLPLLGASCCGSGFPQKCLCGAKWAQIELRWRHPCGKATPFIALACRAPNPGFRNVYYYRHPWRNLWGKGGVAVVGRGKYMYIVSGRCVYRSSRNYIHIFSHVSGLQLRIGVSAKVHLWC